jgi:hypothetical protein
MKLPHNKHQAATMLKHMISELWATVHSIWLSCNGNLHDNTPNQLHSYKCLHILAEIASLYEQAPHMLQPNYCIFNYPLVDRSHHSTASLLKFLQFAKPIVKCSIANTLLGAQTNTLDKYFGPGFPIPPEFYSAIHVTVDPDAPVPGFEYTSEFDSE